MPEMQLCDEYPRLYVVLVVYMLVCASLCVSFHIDYVFMCYSMRKWGVYRRGEERRGEVRRLDQTTPQCPVAASSTATHHLAAPCRIYCFICIVAFHMVHISLFHLSCPYTYAIGDI